MDLKLVVFDVDGTLIDSQDAIAAAMTAAFDGIGADRPSRSAILSIVGLSLDRAVAQLAPSMSARDVDETARLYKEAFVEQRLQSGGEATAPMYPGARAALEALHQRDNLLMGVATGKARRGLDHATRAHDLEHFFVTRQTADGHPSKPHPSMLQAALSETGCDAEYAVMVGDTSFDMEMGRAAGFRTIGVSWGYHPADQLGADVVIDRFDQLETALETLWGVRK